MFTKEISLVCTPKCAKQKPFKICCEEFVIARLLLLKKKKNIKDTNTDVTLEVREILCTLSLWILCWKNTGYWNKKCKCTVKDSTGVYRRERLLILEDLYIGVGNVHRSRQEKSRCQQFIW